MQQLLPPKLVGMLLALILVLGLAFPWPRPGWPFRLIGVIPVVLGLLITVHHARLFDQIGTNIKTFDDPDALVRSGAFGWTRNPMYLGFLLVLAGVALALGAAVAAVGPVAFFVAADRWYIPFEERRLAATFGTNYDEYRTGVPRWVGLRRP